MSRASAAASPREALLAFPRNTRFYAEQWLISGQAHQSEHWLISEKLAGWRKAVELAGLRGEMAAEVEPAIAAPRQTRPAAMPINVEFSCCRGGALHPVLIDPGQWINRLHRIVIPIARKEPGLSSSHGAIMKRSNLGQKQRTVRRIGGHAQQDHILDPYQEQQKLHEGTVCRQCGAVYHDGRWRWMAPNEGELCAACRRINDNFPAGIVTLRGDFAKEHKEEMIHLARHQEEAEKNEHPLNRIISIEEDAYSVVINTTDIHLPRRIGKAIKRAFQGEIGAKFEGDGYFVRVDWTRNS